MRILRKPIFAVALAITVVVACTATLLPQLSARSEQAWIGLLDGENFGEWHAVGAANWRYENGAVIADKRTGEENAFLVSKARYKDFALLVEFWSSDDANSGVFIRCNEPGRPSAKTCYEINIFDQLPEPDSVYGTGSIVYYTEVSPMPKSGGKWNTFEIKAKGRDIVVELNGAVVGRLRNGMWSDGAIALQHVKGTIKFRKVAIRPL